MDWSEWKNTGVEAVDLCASIIYQHLQARKPLKAIHLWPNMYKQFKGWTEKNLGRELEENEGLQFDSVNIEMGERGQKTPALIEPWPVRPETDYQKWIRTGGNLFVMNRNHKLGSRIILQ